MRLQIIGPDLDIPSLITAYGKVEGHEVALALRPWDAQGALMVRKKGAGPLVWRTTASSSGDVPQAPSKTMDSAELNALFNELRKSPERKSSMALRGSWTGTLTLDEGKTRFVVSLERKVAAYGVLRVVSSPHGPGAWETTLGDTTGSHPRLVDALRAGLTRPSSPERAPAARRAPTVRSTTSTRAPKHTAALRAALDELEVGAEILPQLITGPRLTRRILRLPRISDLDRLRRGLEKLSFALGYDGEALSLDTTLGDRRVALDLPRPRAEWQSFGAEALASWKAPATMTLPTCMGVDVLGKPYWFDLAAPEHGHMLIAGTTGSGKSALIHAILCSILQKAPRKVELMLIDPKQVELNAYQQRARVASTGPETDKLLASLVTEMERRYKALSERGARDLQGVPGGIFPRLVVVVEELGSLVVQRPEVQAHLVTLAQKGRAAGLHLIVATQRPDAATFQGALRSNLDTRVALAVRSATESRIILDEAGAERLLKPGDLLLKTPGTTPIRLHSLHLRAADVAKIVKG